MARERHKLSKLDLLDYALEGVNTRYGTQSGYMDEEEEDLLEADRAEIERRIKLVTKANERKQNA